ncbi:LysR family transcriptional regulator [Mesorhizobium sp. CAU 1741]|uniref:LysR family transcriptional regulator n=1 Tax=Mesorhizobium sp. CAU 1741 TaxID=3140366 RepID=UPI00325B82C2
MDTIDNIRAFLVAARCGSFSAAARTIGVAPSVITKRIGRLEDQMKVKLFVRSTRRLQLTEAGSLAIPRYSEILRDLERAMQGEEAMGAGVAGHLRVKVPRTFSSLHLSEIFGEFQNRNPNLTLEIVLVDRSVDPAEEGFDIALGALSPSYWNVHDQPLCPYPRMCCAAPDYIRSRGAPLHPRDLLEHDCLTFHAIGTTWSFTTPQGPVVVEVHSKTSSNDTQLLFDMCRRGQGIAVVARYLAREAIREGKLVEVLPDFAISELWLKALVPLNRMRKPAVQALLAWLRENLEPQPVWDRDDGEAPAS